MTRSDTPEMQLLELFRTADQPSTTDRIRVRENIAFQLAAGATVAATAFAAQHGSWGSIPAWLKGATLASALIGTGAISTLYFADRTPPPADGVTSFTGTVSNGALHDKPAIPTAKSLPKHQSKAVTVKTTIADAVGSTRTKRTVSSSKSQAVTGNADLEEELELIRDANRALRAGQPSEALHALEDHQRRFPAGKLSFERVGIRTVALCQSGRLKEGRSAARSYLRSVPNSVLAKRILVACRMTDE